MHATIDRPTKFGASPAHLRRRVTDPRVLRKEQLRTAASRKARGQRARSSQPGTVAGRPVGWAQEGGERRGGGKGMVGQRAASWAGEGESAPLAELAEVERRAGAPKFTRCTGSDCHESQTAAHEREEQGKRSGMRRPGPLGAVQSRLGCAGCGRVFFSVRRMRAGSERARVQGQGRAGCADGARGAEA